MTIKKVLLALGLTASLSHAATLSVNLTRDGAPTETGFTNWVSADSNLPANLSATLGTDNLTLSVSAAGINDASTLRSIDRGVRAGYTGALPSLSQTWWGQRF